MKARSSDNNFLAIEDPALHSYESSRFVIQSVPYEHTSSYLSGSAKGPEAILSASHFVEFYDEEIDDEAFRKGGIATLDPIDFTDKVDADAVAGDFLRVVAPDVEPDNTHSWTPWTPRTRVRIVLTLSKALAAEFWSKVRGSYASVNQINDLFEINLGCELLTVSKSKLIVSNLLR